MNYPADWPRCVCGEPCMDGKATCGNAACGPSTGTVERTDAYGQKYRVTPAENERLDDVNAQLDAYEELYGDEDERLDQYRESRRLSRELGEPW